MNDEKVSGVKTEIKTLTELQAVINKIIENKASFADILDIAFHINILTFNIHFSKGQCRVYGASSSVA
ncbi:MAG: hypothetical protein NT030_06390 [Candidatus Saganbacteria bacterium]|nr:hypothetical protein [Candidatus Saganbacteria bacterium]